MIVALLIFHGFVTIAMIALILLQKSDSAGPLGMGGGSTNSLFTARGVANVLTRATAVLAFLFIGNCVLIGIQVNSESSETVRLINASAPKGSKQKAPEPAPQEPQALASDAPENNPAGDQGPDTKPNAPAVAEPQVLAKSDGAPENEPSNSAISVDEPTDVPVTVDKTDNLGVTELPAGTGTAPNFEG
jgi:preprotein translocase subunit SecG